MYRKLYIEIKRRRIAVVVKLRVNIKRISSIKKKKKENFDTPIIRMHFLYIDCCI